MNSLSRMWFQMARGRAIVRNRSMREARYWRALLDCSPEVQRDALRYSRNMSRRGRRLRSFVSQGAPSELRLWIVSFEVSAARRARWAHQDWRRYRANAAEFDDEPAPAAARASQ